MTSSVKPTHFTAAACITHSTVVIRGQQYADVSVHHARTPDARISMAFNGVHMLLYSCGAAQGLREAFAAARAQMVHIPSVIPSPRTDPQDVDARVALSLEWTRRPAYAVVAQSALNRLKTAQIHWIDLYTGPITWQIRDKAGLLSMIELLARVHATATAVFADGEQHSADPTVADYRSA